jgi:hypothetical protein
MRKELDELFRWCHESKRLAGPAVKAAGDPGEISEHDGLQFVST